MNFAIGPLAAKRAAVVLQDDIAEPRRALAARPLVQLVEEGARLGRGARRWDGAHHAAGLDDGLEGVEGHLLPRELLVTSAMMSGLRRSGLSLPYFSIASA
jgi:hypothetical protein